MVRTSAVIGTLALALGILTATPTAPASADEVTIAYDRLLTGPTTGLVRPWSLDVAPDGRVVVSTRGDHPGTTVPSSVRVFPPTATGDVAPAATIDHSPSQYLFGALGMGVGPEGHIHVGLLGDNSIRRFNPAGGSYGADGAAASGPSGVVHPADVAAPSASTLWVASLGTDEAVLINLTGARQRVLGTPSPAGVAVAGSAVYVAGGMDAGTYVKVYGPGADTPVRTITGPATGLTSVGGLDVDSHGRIYVADPDDGSIKVFPAAADGNAAPATVLRGAPGSGLRDVALDADDNIWVAGDTTAGAVGRIPALPPPPPSATAPAAPRALKVTGRPGAPKRIVRWKVPAVDGGAPVTSYRVVVKKGAKKVLTRSTTERKLVLKRKALRNGKHVVRVRAINAAGTGPAAAKRFRVRK